MAAFSKRHLRALREDHVRVRLGLMTRGRIRRLLERFNERYSNTDERGFNYEADTLDDLAGELLDLYGRDALPHAKSDRDVGSFVEAGPEYGVFDAVELFATISNGRQFAQAVNQLLAEEAEPWRMLDGQMVMLDADFARDELAERADGALRAAGFEGASTELRRARSDVVDGDGRGAVHKAGNALEGVMMALLQRDEGKAKQLLQTLNRDGYFDGLPVRLRERFISEVMTALPWMRNNLGGHGQGETRVDIPRAYGELATDLAAAFSHFLITLQFERDGTHLQEASATAPAGLSASEDVIPQGEQSHDDEIPF